SDERDSWGVRRPCKRGRREVLGRRGTRNRRRDRTRQTAAGTCASTMSRMLRLVSTLAPFFSATGASGAAGGAGEVSMDSPGTSTPRGVMRTFLDDRPHVPQYAKLSPITIHTHLISEFLAGAW